MKKPSLIRTKTKPRCVCCGADGYPLYQHLKDRLFGVEGFWSINRCASPSCGLLWLDPAPVTEDIHLAYQNYYTHAVADNTKKSLFSRIVLAYQGSRFGYKPVETGSFFRWASILISILPFFREHMDYPFLYLNDVKRGKLLELGAGSGETLRKFVEWGWDAEGLDFDPKAVKACEAIGLNVRQGDLAAQNFEGETFDAIFSSHVLEHVPDPLMLMQESVRVLKKGGAFVAVTPNARSALHRLFKSNWRGLEPPRHLNIFTVNALMHSAKLAGFSRVEVVTSNFSAAGVFYHSAYLAGVKRTFVLRIFSNFARLILTFLYPIFKGSGEELILVAYR